MINTTKAINLKNILAVFVMCITFVLWIVKREARKSFFKFFLPDDKINIMIKNKNSQRLMNISRGTEIQIFRKNSEFEDMETILPLNGQILIEK